jgi:hypothetical protein
MDLRPRLVVAACLALGLSGCYAPLQREDGYPADWPEPLVLSRGFPEIDGTYANRGTLLWNEGALGEIRLASLVPQRWTFGQPVEAVPNPSCMESQRARVEQELVNPLCRVIV